MNSLVIIPARGGSKGISRKNIKALNGKPLIYYTIDAAREVFDDARICVSTEDEEIKQVVESYGLEVPFRRPAELATDEASSYEVLLHALSHFEEKGEKIDTVILLQATSPFRTGKHIKEALCYYDNSCDMVVSVVETKANPYYSLREENADGWLQKSKNGSFIRRQDCPKVYELNGAIYIINAQILRHTPPAKMTRVRKYIMDEQVSVDLDTPMDWKFAEFLLSRYNK